MANQLSKIKYVVQVMLENRSFDQMLGFLYSDTANVSDAGQPFDGLTGKETNPDGTGRDVAVYKIDATAPHPYFMPGADPGEGFYNTNLQLFSEYDVGANVLATNQGFIINFKAAIAADLAKKYHDSLPGTVPSEIMAMYSPEMLPIMSSLARGFAVCDRWFAAAPTQTIPNRAFAAAATSQGHLDNHVKVFTCPSIFGRLSDKGLDWAIFGYNRDPLTKLDFPDTQSADASHFGHFRDFQKRAAAGTLPAYSFLEPDFGANGNSQHPNYDVSLGEQLLHDIYYALRNGPGWNETLLLVTYDEHGGNYDHVAPPTNAVKPDDTVGEFGFDFQRFGIRIPALLISPRIARGTVFRAKNGTIDHTSVLKTLELRFGLEPLTRRDAAAPDLGDALTLQVPRTDDPLAGKQVPASSVTHPNRSRPSKLEKIHATRLAELPIRDDHGGYEHAPPTLASSADLGNYIRGRSAAWTEHVARAKSGPPDPKAPATRNRRDEI